MKGHLVSNRQCVKKLSVGLVQVPPGNGVIHRLLGFLTDAELASLFADSGAQEELSDSARIEERDRVNPDQPGVADSANGARG